MHNLNPKNFAVDEIVSIELVGEEDTVDITVEDTHMFFANDVYSHNSSSEEDIIEGNQIAEDWSKLMTADFVMSLSRKVEDKISNTARFHVIKNRFGKDGVTYAANFNASNGRIEIYEGNTSGGKEAQSKMDNSSEFTRKRLATKYAELG